MASDLPIPSDPPSVVVETGAGPISIAEEGPADGLPILCVHGIPGSHRDFRYLAPLLAERFRVVRVEMPGFGASPPDGAATLQSWARALLALAEARGFARYALLSHSFGGGGVLLAAAEAQERLAGIVLLASMGARRHRAFTMPPAAYAALSVLISFPATRPLFVAGGRRFYRRIGLTPPDDWRELHRHTSLLASVSFAELGAAARRIQAPALVAHCADDRLVETAIARELAALLPHGRLLEYPTGGHHMQKTRARAVAAEVAAFLEH